ncbi:unnamed protein product [Miscanthus lutarioriparius]|uniref:Uncharacterized protein n=1 Tax=Miscanthus lutarioriparius TaxID=422564 RepID=A0A811N489_9POAL|nr:unnamed protein product [Miscanthus lutarioriparius]
MHSGTAKVVEYWEAILKCLHIYKAKLMHGNEDEDAIDPEEDKDELDRKREAVVLEHQRKVQEAMKAKARVPDEMEMKAIKTM